MAGVRRYAPVWLLPVTAAGLALGCFGDYRLVDPEGTIAPPNCDGHEVLTGDTCRPVGMQPESCPWGVLADGTCDLEGGGAGADGCVVLEQPDWVVSTRVTSTALGTQAAPFRSIQQAVDAASAGDSIFVEVGAYPESVVIDGKAVVIVGECGSIEGVVVDGSLLDAPALVVRGADASGTEIHGLTAKGFAGIWVEGAGSLTLGNVKTVDTDGEGIRATDLEELTIGDLTVQNAGGGAVLLNDVERATIERATIEATRAIGPRGLGMEIVGVPELVMRNVVVSRSPGTGLVLYGGAGTLEDVLVTGSGAEGRYAAGIRAHGFRGTMTRVLVTDTSNAGIEVAMSSEVQLSDCAVLRSGARAPAAAEAIAGITSGNALRVVHDSAVEVMGCTLSGSTGTGIHVQGSGLTLRDSIVDDVTADAAGEFGDGLAVYPGERDAVAESTSSRQPEPRVIVEGTVIGEAARAGIANFGSIVELDASMVRCTGLGIVGEPFGGRVAERDLLSNPVIDDQGFWFVDHGGNVCGCDAIWERCRRHTPGLMPAALPGELLPPQ